MAGGIVPVQGGAAVDRSDSSDFTAGNRVEASRDAFLLALELSWLARCFGEFCDGRRFVIRVVVEMDASRAKDSAAPLIKDWDALPNPSASVGVIEESHIGFVAPKQGGAS